MRSSEISRLTGTAYYRWIHRRRDPERQRIRDWLMASQFWSYENLRGLQEQKLRALLQRAQQTSSWYRERLTGSPSPERFTLGDLASLPILEKAELQAHLAEITGDGRLIPGTYAEFSGGSTGTPVRFYHTPTQASFINADLERDFAMCAGYELGQAIAFVWGAPRYQRGARWKDRLVNRLWLGGLAVEGNDIGAYLERLRAFSPRLIVGYVSILSDLARVAGRPLTGLRAIETSAETLTDEHRELIGQAFGAPLYNRYGAREFGNLAHECDAHAGLHLLMENNIVEIVDDAGQPLAEPGAEGEVVVTSLNNVATPLIRYRLGDVARVGEVSCRCGRGAPMLASVLGRTSGVIITPGGRHLHGEFFSHLFYGQPVRQFDVEQTTETDLVIRVVPDLGYDAQVRESVMRAIAQEGDVGLVVEWREVPELAPRASGKFLFTTSRLHAGAGSGEVGARLDQRGDDAANDELGAR